MTGRALGLVCVSYNMLHQEVMHMALYYSTASASGAGASGAEKKGKALKILDHNNLLW